MPEVSVYSLNAAKKAKVIKLLEKRFLDDLNKHELYDLFKMEISLSAVLGDMECNGLYVDVEKLEYANQEFAKKIQELSEEIYAISGEEFNINSSKQVGEILFDKLGLPSSKKTKTGYSTNVDVLEDLSRHYDIAKKILEYRTYSKLSSTYVKGMKLVMDDKQFIHPLYKQALTVTGRLSSVEPNIQNMPIRTEEGQIIRDVFASRFDNGKIMSIDYSQIELRILAHMANDPAMIELFNSGVDFHTATASNIFNVKTEEVTKTMRRYAKAINFGIIYGMSAWGLSETIGVSPKDASFYRFKAVDEFLKKTVSDAKDNGYTKTMFNRIRYIPELASMNKNIYEFGKRTAMNAPIQGSAADIIKMAMIKVKEAFDERKYKSLLIAQVHDELVFDIYPGEENEIALVVKDIMENTYPLKVKLIAEVSIGDTWLKA